jgi:hypothetical protein
MKTANQTKLCGLAKNDPNSSEPNAVFAVFGLDWFDLRFYFWVGSVLNTPTTMYLDLKSVFWYSEMKKEMDNFVYACLTYHRLKIEL